jgi:hypothetical protein
MRASKLITLSAAAVLAGGTSLAFAAPLQSGTPSSSSMSQGIGPHAASPQHGGAYGHATPRELSEAGTTLNPQERTRLREIVHDIPRLSYIGNTDIRIDGFVPKTVRQAAVPLPLEVQRMHPRFKRDIAFRYRDQVVILNPTTARIVAIIKTPA